MRFSIGSGQKLIVTDAVLATWSRYKQDGLFAREAGGMIFAEISGDTVKLSHISEPSFFDLRSRFRFTMNFSQAQKEIEKRFRDNLHYVGEWHTHPEAIPQPSKLDQRTIVERFKVSTLQLDGIILVIVGLEKIYFALQDNQGLRSIITVDHLPAA